MLSDRSVSNGRTVWCWSLAYTGVGVRYGIVVWFLLYFYKRKDIGMDDLYDCTLMIVVI